MADVITIHGYEIDDDGVRIDGEQGGVRETVSCRRAAHIRRREATGNPEKLQGTLKAYWRANRTGPPQMPEDRVGGFDS